MNKRVYDGLDFEIITFGKDDISTTAIPAQSGCKLGTVTNFQEDGSGNKMPIGVCWVKEADQYILNWENQSGSFIPPSTNP